MAASPLGVVLAAIVVAGSGVAIAPAHANGYGESAPWQFETSADKANKALLEDLIQRKKGGYYDSFHNIYNTYNNTSIERQVNCSVSATAAGNSGNNGLSSSVSSPDVTNTGSTSANTTGNTSTNGYAHTGPAGVVLDVNGTPLPAGTVDNNQDNSGTLTAGVDDSSTSVTSGAINAGGGTNSQVLNSDQSNTGAQTASVADSTACLLASNGGALN